MSFYKVSHLSAGYGGKMVIDSVSFRCEKGTITGLLGANGSGKTTLLNALCNILPHKGETTLNGEMLDKLSPRKMAQLISYIPQRSGISIDISVLDVVLMGFNPHLGLLEYPDKKMKERAINALERVGLKGKEHMNFQHLSQGQRQLCILARTLISDASLFILDEPESALDFKFRYHAMNIIKSLVRDNAAAIISLHDPTLALNYCDTLLVLSEGKIKATLYPKTDSLEKMEKALCEIYGEISLTRCKNNNDHEFIIMLTTKEAL